MKLSLITLVAASVVYSYSYQVVKQDFLHNTELGKKKHQLNNSKETRSNQLTGNTRKENISKTDTEKEAPPDYNRETGKTRKKEKTPTDRHELKQRRQSKNKLASPRKSETVTDSSSIKQSI